MIETGITVKIIIRIAREGNRQSESAEGDSVRQSLEAPERLRAWVTVPLASPLPDLGTEIFKQRETANSQQSMRATSDVLPPHHKVTAALEQRDEVGRERRHVAGEEAHTGALAARPTGPPHAQGLTLVHFSAQLEPCLTHTKHPTHPKHPLTPP